MNQQAPRKLAILDEYFEKLEGHFYEYDKSVVEIFQHHGFKTVVYGHKDMISAFCEELGAQPTFTTNAGSRVRKIPILGAILYRRAFWKNLQKEIEAVIHKVGAEKEETLLFFPNVYWYNILPIVRALKNVNTPAALLIRVSIFDTIQLPKAMLRVTLGIIKHATRILKNNRNVHFYSDSEVIADEWIAHFRSDMKVLPIPHLALNIKPTTLNPNDKVRMYLPGGMRIEKGAQLLTEAFEVLAKSRPEILNRIQLVTQFFGSDPVLTGYKGRLATLPLENVFLERLTTEEYNEQLRNSDVILIPYQVSEGYRARTSGILAEAIASSKPFITTDGTWMSLQARKYDTGLIINDNQPAELANAIAVMVTEYGTYNTKAKVACGKWMESQSKEVFYTQLASALG